VLTCDYDGDNKTDLSSTTDKGARRRRQVETGNGTSAAAYRSTAGIAVST